MIKILLIIDCIIQAIGAYRMYVNSPINKTDSALIFADVNYNTPNEKKQTAKNWI